MDIYIDYPSVKIIGFIKVTIKNQDDVDDFNENAQEILAEFSDNNNLLKPQGGLDKTAPCISASENDTYKVLPGSSDVDHEEAKSLSFPFSLKVMSNDYLNFNAE